MPIKVAGPYRGAIGYTVLCFLLPYIEQASLDIGTVQFQSNVDTSVTTCGAIGKDGTYSLTTMRDGLESVGAVAGSNRVFVTTIRHQQGRDLPFSALSPSPYDVKPHDNEFNVVVDVDGIAAEAAPR
jgi:hypothetical protein